MSEAESDSEPQGAPAVLSVDHMVWDSSHGSVQSGSVSIEQPSASIGAPSGSTEPITHLCWRRGQEVAVESELKAKTRRRPMNTFTPDRTPLPAEIVKAYAAGKQSSQSQSAVGATESGGEADVDVGKSESWLEEDTASASQPDKVGGQRDNKNLEAQLHMSLSKRKQRHAGAVSNLRATMDSLERRGERRSRSKEGAPAAGKGGPAAEILHTVWDHSDDNSGDAEDALSSEATPSHLSAPPPPPGPPSKGKFLISL
eukprot:gb/GFBE01047107.1/.p1 GENE.gb/GFBE01047107.1/~~gb/GFBE01047107.1/.p1  ORF type:complete len:257 (+),score=24.12 gb/GFBE01047107.1/:1-771(+)